jgi:hypothetical protein
VGIKTGHDVPPLIKSAALQYLRIGVGSEVSCMINPDVCWVANTRTIWTNLVIKYGGDFAKAAEALKLYRESEVTSEMAYQMWTDLHGELAATMRLIATDGAKLAKAAKVTPGAVAFLWADAIANQPYADYKEAWNGARRSVPVRGPARGLASWIGNIVDGTRRTLFPVP